VPVKNYFESNYYIQKADFDLRRTASIEAPLPALGACDPALDSVSFAGSASQSLTLDANLGCTGLVVISETYFPGWKVTIDGVPSEIREVDGALRGVVVPQGRHRIRMRYRPGSFIAGAWLTLAGVLAICALGFWERRRARV